MAAVGAISSSAAAILARHGSSHPVRGLVASISDTPAISPSPSQPSCSRQLEGLWSFRQDFLRYSDGKLFVVSSGKARAYNLTQPSLPH